MAARTHNAIGAPTTRMASGTSNTVAISTPTSSQTLRNAWDFIPAILPRAMAALCALWDRRVRRRGVTSSQERGMQ